MIEAGLGIGTFVAGSHQPVQLFEQPGSVRAYATLITTLPNGPLARCS